MNKQNRKERERAEVLIREAQDRAIAECMQRLDRLEQRHNGLTETFELRDAKHDKQLADLDRQVADLKRRADFNAEWQRQAHDSRLDLRDRVEAVEALATETMFDCETHEPDEPPANSKQTFYHGQPVSVAGDLLGYIELRDEAGPFDHWVFLPGRGYASSFADDNVKPRGEPTPGPRDLTKPSPAPWSVREDTDGLYISSDYDRNPDPVCDLNHSGDYASAHLIAAAPDMLAALKGIRAWFRRSNLDTKFDKSIDAAIRKAEGRS